MMRVSLYVGQHAMSPAIWVEEGCFRRGTKPIPNWRENISLSSADVDSHCVHTACQAKSGGYTAAYKRREDGFSSVGVTELDKMQPESCAAHRRRSRTVTNLPALGNRNVLEQISCGETNESDSLFSLTDTALHLNKQHSQTEH